MDLYSSQVVMLLINHKNNPKVAVVGGVGVRGESLLRGMRESLLAQFVTLSVREELCYVEIT